MADLGPTQCFLGMNIDTTETSFALYMYQTTYIESLLQRFSMADAHGVDTPLDSHVSLEITPNDSDKPANQTEYLAIISFLMYEALGTHPDISYAVNLLSRYNIDPRTRHLTAAKRVFRYLKKQKTSNQFTKNLKDLKTTTFVDSSMPTGQTRWIENQLEDMSFSLEVLQSLGPLESNP